MKAEIVTLRNSRGMSLKVANIGGTALALRAPDRNGRLSDVLLGFDEPPAQKDDAYMGALIGRVGNRIARGRFTLDGKEYQLALNTEPAGRPCSIHGGQVGFDRRAWQMRKFKAADGPAVELTYFSPAGEENYPGNLFTRVVYTLTDENVWRIEYWAMTDAATPVNLTQHAYFNLTGGKRDILDHELQLFCDQFTPTDEGLIPTGEILPVRGTPFDFTKPHLIGERIEADHPQLKLANGYDHNFVIRRRRNQADELLCCARVSEPRSGRVLEVWTTEPCVQLYTGNFLDGTVVGKRGHAFGKRSGFCLETQHAPDSPNQPEFPDITLRPGSVYRHTTEYRFTTC